jgi:uncharacterized Zn-binding protein involved in type VI secretion
VACVAGAALGGGQLARGIQTAAGLSHPVTGAIGPVCSPNVFIGMLPAARAMADMAPACHGLFALNHIPMPPLPVLPAIAEGSATVKFNNFHAARVTSKLICAAEITLGCPTVIIGGPTVRVLDVFDLEAFWQDVASVALLAALAGMVILTGVIAGLGAGLLAGLIAAGKALGVVAAFMGLFELVGLAGDQIGPGWRDILQGALGVGAVVFGGARAGRALRRPQARRGIPPDEMGRIVDRARTNEELNIIRDPNPDSLPYHGRSTPEGGRYLPKPLEEPPPHLHTARDGPHRGVIVNEDGTPYVDSQGNRYYGDMDLQGVYRRNPETGEWVSEPTNRRTWQDQYNEDIAPSRTGRDRPVQHGANDNYRPQGEEGPMGRQPNPNETYTVVEPDGTVRRINNSAELQEYYRRNGIDWPYRDYTRTPGATSSGRLPDSGDDG